MNSKRLIMICLLIGSTIGGIIPQLWGASGFSFSSVFLTAIGGFVGIYIGYRMSR